MASEGERCGGFGSFLAMSCRGRAEAFARRLHSKLRSLGTQDDNGSVNESSWLAAHENSIAISQPAHTSNTEKFLDLELFESPGSPEVELEEVDFNKFMNKDTLQTTRTGFVDVKKTPLFVSNSIESESDLPFYDTEDRRIGNHTSTNGVECFEDDCEAYMNSQDNSITSECTSQQVVSLSQDASMLSIIDEDLSSSLSDLSKCNGDESSKCDNNIDVKICVSVDSIDSINSNEKTDSTSLNKENGDNDDDDDELEKTPRVRRSTSLKTGKTPPGTPGQKKIVRFADALGLDLADVRTFLDDIPKIPNSAFQDLLQADLSESSSECIITSRVQNKVTKYLMPLFQQPGGLPNFLDIVRESNVCLENVYVEDPMLLTLKGTVRVRNLDFNKSVHIRYTLNSWKTFADVQGTYVVNSCDGFSDKFTFTLYAHTICIGQRLELACRFQCKGCQYWDNNKGSNYCFQCLPPTQSNPHPVPISPHDDWGASFY